METLALALALNHYETADGSRQTAVSPALHRLPAAVRHLPYLFITYAVEIEGDAPLFFFAEAVDD